MNEMIRSHFKKLFGRTAVRRASRRWMACERLERRELLAVVKWIGGSFGTWNSQSNWDLRVPEATDDVEIVSAWVTVNTAAVAKSVKTGGSLVVDGSSLNISGNLTQTGSSASITIMDSGFLKADQVTSGGALSIQKRSSLVANSVTTAGNVTVGANATLSTTPFSELRVDGPLKTGGLITLLDKGQITNANIDSRTTIFVGQIAGSSDFSVAPLLKNVTAAGPIDMNTRTAKLLVEQQLTLNNSTVSLGAIAKLGFQGSTAALLGTGTIVLNNLDNNGLATVDDLMTLTIGPDITIRGGNTTANIAETSHIGGVGSFATVILQGKVIVENGMNLRLGNATIQDTSSKVILGANASIVTRGTLFVDGKFGGAGVSKVTSAGSGTVQLVGTLDNTGGLTPDFKTMWVFDDGEVLGGTIRQTASTGLQFTRQRGWLRDVTIEGDTTLANNVGFDVTGTLTYNGKVNIFGGGIWFAGAEASLLGQATIAFVENAQTDCNLIGITDGMKLTIGQNVTITGGSNNGRLAIVGARSAPLQNSVNNATLEFFGKVLANLPGRTITVAATAKLINKGSIEARGGTVEINGSFNRAELGSVTNVGGFIQILGTLDNRDSRLELNATTGSWHLLGGTILGGTIVQGVHGIKFTNQGGILDNVRVEGDIDLSVDAIHFTAKNNLQLVGTARIGFNSRISFSGSQVFDGDATVDFLYRTGGFLRLEGTNMTLTVGPNVVLKAGATFKTGGTPVAGIVNYLSNAPTVRMNGKLLSDKVNATIQIDIGAGKVELNGQVDSQLGEVRFANGMQTLSIPPTAQLRSAPSGAINIGPNFEYQGQTADNVSLLGTTRFNGSAQAGTPQLLDAASDDIGPLSEGFVESNFLIGTLHVVGNSVLKLYDVISNADKDPAKPDAVYVNTLIVDANATLDLGGIRLYARSVQIKGTSTIKDSVTATNRVIVVNGGGALPFNMPIPARIDPTPPALTLHTWTFQGRDGARVNFNLAPVTTTFWIRFRLVDPTGVTVITTVSASAGAALTGLSNIELKHTGLYRVLIDADPTRPGSGDYTITATDISPERRRVNVVVTSTQPTGVDYGNSIDVIANVTPRAITVPNATGTVQFKLDGIDIGAPVLLVNGVARLTLSRLEAGARNFTAVFISDNGAFDNQQTLFVQQIRRKVLNIIARDVPGRIAGSSLDLLYDITGFVDGEGSEQLTDTPRIEVDEAARTTAGTYTIFVSAGNLAAANYSFQFSTAVMVVLPAAPASLNIVAGGEQAVRVNRSLPLRFKLKVLDAYSNVVPGATVTFVAPTGSGTFSGGTLSATAVANSLGEAQAPAFTVSDQIGVYAIAATCNQATANFSVTIRDASLPLEFLPMADLRETDGNVSLTLERRDISVPLTVTLAIDLPDFVSASQMTVFFPVGVDTQTWNATIINDLLASTLIGGAAKQVLISASASGLSASLRLLIVDDDVPALQLEAPVSLNEGETKTITITRNTVTASDLVVKLVSSDSRVLTVPESITIPANQKFVTVPVNALADRLAFGPHAANILVTAVGLNSTSSRLEVVDVDVPTLTLEQLGTASIQEGGSAPFRISRNTPADSDLVIRLNTTGTSVTSLDIPSTVTIPTGASYVEFLGRTANDQVVDVGARTLQIKANATGFPEVTRGVSIDEDDVPTLTLTLDRTEVIEGSQDESGVLVTLTRNTAARPALNVGLVLEPAGRLLASAISFSEGAEFTIFALTAFENNTFEGLQNVRFTTTAAGFLDASASLQVIDNEQLKLAPKSGRTLSENGGLLTYTVTRDVGNLETAPALVVNLLTSDTSELSVSSTVIIPAGAASVDFNVSGVDDIQLDGTQTVQVLASASGYGSAVETAAVTDYEPIDVQLDISSVEENGGEFIATITRSGATDLSSELVITVENSHPLLLDFPNTVTIPAGQASITATGTARVVTSSEKDVQATLKFVAPNYVAGQTSLTIMQVRIWHNVASPLDVNHDGSVTALDALLVINWLNTHGNSEVYRDSFDLSVGYVDTSADDFVTALDALLVINRLNNPNATGEGEAVVDSVFADYDLDGLTDHSKKRNEWRR